MWIDERGSDVLELPECRRLLALGATEHRHGHLGVCDSDGPVVLPVDYATEEMDVIIRVGEGLFRHVANRVVAFQVDGRTAGQAGVGWETERSWSVLVQGLATEALEPVTHLPSPRVVQPGDRLVRIRTDVMTGRRLGLARLASQVPS
jgi:hypothetical protein